MTDFAICVNDKCPLKLKCYRYGRRPIETNLSYARFVFLGGLNIPVYCNHFMPYPDDQVQNVGNLPEDV